ncbi:CinA family nicotinamide mononucleotide deamidase-related protein [Myroides sp. LJL116]
MTASIVTIGDEILIGQIVNTNSAFIARELDQIGCEVVQICSIADKSKNIRQIMSSFIDQVDLVVLTGGLGPTKDDITKKVFCEFFEDHFVMDPLVLQQVCSILAKPDPSELLDIEANQALVPSLAKVFFNSYGTAPGMLMRKGNTTFIILPGVPLEMKTIWKEEVLDYIKQHFKSNVVLHKSISTYAIEESELAQILAPWENTLPSEVTLAYLPLEGRVNLRLTARGRDENELKNKLKQCLQSIPFQVFEFILGYEDIDFSQIISKELHIRNKTISFAESCTGGRLAIMFNSNPGASAYFKGGIIPYATSSKIDILGVDPYCVEKYSVVSEQVAIEMAKKAKLQFASDFAVATTGNAGPKKGDSSADVGTVYIGIATPNKVFAKKFQFHGSRERVVNCAVSKGLELIYKEIIKK